MFFAHDPGGAHAIAPLIPRFNNSYVFAKGPALNILPKAVELPNNALQTFSPAFLITGTSANDFTERYLWKEAAEFSIPSMAILDMWVDYGVRFSRYGSSELHLFDGTCEYLPKFVCVMDDIAKEDMVKDGVPEEIIFTLGNPHFEYIASQKLSHQPAVNNRKVILYASQPFDDMWRKDSELIVLNDLVKISREYDNLEIYIRKHPRESGEKFAGYISERIFLDKNVNVFDSIQSAEIIVSVNSMMLIEASFFEKKIISYQPKSKDGKNDFILTRIGALPFISNSKEFRNYFSELIHKKDYFHIDNKIRYTGIIDSIAAFVKEHMNE